MLTSCLVGGEIEGAAGGPGTQASLPGSVSCGPGWGRARPLLPAGAPAVSSSSHTPALSPGSGHSCRPGWLSQATWSCLCPGGLRGGRAGRPLASLSPQDLASPTLTSPSQGRLFSLLSGLPPVSGPGHIQPGSMGARWPPRMWGHVPAAGLGAQAWPSCSLASSPHRGPGCLFTTQQPREAGVGGVGGGPGLPSRPTRQSLAHFLSSTYISALSSQGPALAPPGHLQSHPVPGTAPAAPRSFSARPGEVGVLIPSFSLHLPCGGDGGVRRSPAPAPSRSGEQTTESHQSSAPWSPSLQSQRFGLTLLHRLAQPPVHSPNSWTRSGHGLYRETAAPPLPPTPILPICTPSTALTSCVPAAPHLHLRPVPCVQGPCPWCLCTGLH